MTPLSINNLLVEVCLTLHLFSNNKSSLVVVGFMSKYEDSEDRLLMVDSNSGNVLAINHQFSQLVKNKITGNQVIQDDIRLSSVLPELNMSLLK